MQKLSRTGLPLSKKLQSRCNWVNASRKKLSEDREISQVGRDLLIHSAHDMPIARELYVRVFFPMDMNWAASTYSTKPHGKDFVVRETGRGISTD